jgi:integrase/recombinase XerD
MRIGELLSIKKEDIRSDWGIEIVGKGRKRRVVFLTPDIQKSINFYEYLKVESCIFSEYVFVSHSNNNSRWKRLSRNSVEELFRKINTKLWIKEHITPHSFRHGFATEVVRKRWNLADLQKTLWHENIKTTGIYIHSNDERVKKTQWLVSWIGEHLMKLQMMEQKWKDDSPF